MCVCVFQRYTQNQEHMPNTLQEMGKIEIGPGEKNKYKRSMA